MNKVYVFKHETYDYDYSDYDISLTVFSDMDSAIRYLAEIRKALIESLLKDFERETYEEFLFHETIDHIDEKDKFYIYIKEWGYEELSIQEQDVMSF